MSDVRRSCARVFASLSNARMANALVSRRVTLWCCWTQLALWAAVETKRELTWTLVLCFSDQGEAQSSGKLCYLCFFFFFFVFESEHTHLQTHTSHRQERRREWVSKQETLRGRWKKSQVWRVSMYITFQSIWTKGRKRSPSCLIILEEKKPKDRRGMVEVLAQTAYFNFYTGVLIYCYGYTKRKGWKNKKERKKNKENIKALTDEVSINW